MGFFKKILGVPDSPMKSYSDFWNWFVKNEKEFAKAIRTKNDVEKHFFTPVSSKLNELKDGFFFLVSLGNPNHHELTFTADGAIENFVFIEELVAASPIIPGWKFIALKQPHDVREIKLEYAEHFFNHKNLFFYSPISAKQPDSIDINLVYTGSNDSDEEKLQKGIFLFIENVIGEYRMATVIDRIQLLFEAEAEIELIPISKLEDYLTWREKEFVEKYDGIRKNTEHDKHRVAEASDAEDRPHFCLYNQDLADWDRKPSHPWIVQIRIGYDGRNNHGLPDEPMSAFMQKFEEDLIREMKDENGYLYVARITGNDVRDIFFACKEFRLPSKAMGQRKFIYKGKLKLDFWIFKDKYWNFLHDILPE